MPAEFPWPTPDPGDLTDPGGFASARTAREMILWFVRRWAPFYELPPTSPLGLVLEMVRRVCEGEPTGQIGSAEEQFAWRHRFLAVRLLARRISALHGRAGVLREVHESFITQELSGMDQATATWGMPRGIGTVCLAGRLLQASGGEVVLLGHGKSGTGHDIAWKPALGGAALIERKDRAYDAGIEESLEERVRYIAGKVLEAGPRIPQQPGAARVLAVGLPGFVPPQEAPRVRRRILRHLEDRLGTKLSPATCPDYLIIEFAGHLRTVGADDEMGTFSHVIDFDLGRTEWAAVRRAFSRAFTIQGALEPGGPWPIRADYIPMRRPRKPKRRPRRRRKHGRRIR